MLGLFSGSPRLTFGSTTQTIALLRSAPLLVMTAVPGLLKLSELSIASSVR